MNGLAPTLQALEPTALVRLIIGLGKALDPRPGSYRSMNFKEPVVLATDAYGAIGIDIARFRAIEEAKQIIGTDVIKGERLHRQYPASRVEEIAKEWRGSRRAVALGYYLGVPAYGIEQLACVARVTRVTEPAVGVLDPQLRIVADSADAS